MPNGIPFVISIKNEIYFVCNVTIKQKLPNLNEKIVLMVENAKTRI